VRIEELSSLEAQKGFFLRRQVPSILVAIVRLPFAKNGCFWWKRREKSLKLQGNPTGTTCKWRPLASRDIELENWKHMLETTMLGGIMGWFSVWMRKQRLGHKVALWGQTFSQSLYKCHADVSNGWIEDQRRALMTGRLVVGYFKKIKTLPGKWTGEWIHWWTLDTLVDWDSLGEKNKQLDRFEIMNTAELKNS